MSISNINKNNEDNFQADKKAIDSDELLSETGEKLEDTTDNEDEFQADKKDIDSVEPLPEIGRKLEDQKYNEEDYKRALKDLRKQLMKAEKQIEILESNEQENIAELRYKERLKEEKIEKIKEDEEKADRRKLYNMSVVFIFASMIIIFSSINNPAIYIIEPDTVSFISQAFNALVLLIIPLFLGSLGAISRVLMSGLTLVKNTTVIISSGMMGMFSWVGIKSGIFVSLLAPHVEKSGVDMTSLHTSSPSDFYAMALVAIFVGMFSSNVYIMINSRVEQLTNTKSENKNPPNKPI
ncbi:hypothetical protein AB6C71_09955 [Vibrio splendidus]